MARRVLNSSRGLVCKNMVVLVRIAMHRAYDSHLTAGEKKPCCAWGSWEVPAQGCQYHPLGAKGPRPGCLAADQPYLPAPRLASRFEQRRQTVQPMPQLSHLAELRLPLPLCQVLSPTIVGKGVAGSAQSHRLQPVHHPVPPLAKRLHPPPADGAYSIAQATY